MVEKDLDKRSVQTIKFIRGLKFARLLLHETCRYSLCSIILDSNLFTFTCIDTSNATNATNAIYLHSIISQQERQQSIYGHFFVWIAGKLFLHINKANSTHKEHRIKKRCLTRKVREVLVRIFDKSDLFLKLIPHLTPAGN
jgi:hypothetical protein